MQFRLLRIFGRSHVGNHNPSAGRDDPRHLGKYFLRIYEMMKRETADRPSESSAGEGEAFHLAQREGGVVDLALSGLVARPPERFVQHVNTDGAGAALGEGQGGRAGAACDIQHAVTARYSR